MILRKILITGIVLKVLSGVSVTASTHVNLPWLKDGKVISPKVTCYVKCHVDDHGKSEEIYKETKCTFCHGTSEQHKQELKYALVNSDIDENSKEGNRHDGALVENQKLAIIRLKSRQMKIKINDNISTPDGMLYIPAGEFIMGSNERWDDEGPEHVRYLDAFFIDKYEVTNRKYKAFVDAAGHKPPTDWEDNTYEEGKDDFPVVYVNWFDVSAYAKWAGKRLPTEAEWEKTGRGTDGRVFPWGIEFSPEHCNEPQRESEGTEKVGSFPSGISPYGAYDMVGNVWEWVDAWYMPHPGNMEVNDLYGKTYRLSKGGSWYNCLYYNCGISAPMYNRAYFVPTTMNSSLGFRCVKDVN